MNKKRIMIVEDDAGILEAMQMILEDADYEVITASNGNCVEKIKTNLPDLLLLDIWMSGADGMSICKQLKNQKTTKNIPIIICSANKDTEKLAKEGGADDFIVKPFEMEELLSKVKKYIHSV